MNRQVFEYQIDSREFEPYYSQYVRGAKPLRTKNAEQIVAKQLASMTSAKKEECSADEEVAAIYPASEAVAETRIPATDETVDAATKSDHFVAIRQKMTGEHFNGGRVREFVSVHALGQFVFCHRAGVQSLESDDKLDVDEPAPRLTYLPNFDRDRIQEELLKQLRLLTLSFVYLIVAIAVMYLAVSRMNQLLFLTGFGVLLVNLVWGSEVFLRVVVLIDRRRQADAPKPLKINLSAGAATHQRVNWWSVLAAGFEPGRYQSPIRHPEWPLEGRPWRVLKHGSLRIPVIRSGAKRIANRKGVLHDKHRCQLASYCALLESMGNYESPFGLVFPAHSVKGVAMVVSPAMHGKVSQTLADFLKTVELSVSELAEPKQPAERSRCSGCPLGEPIEISQGEYKRARKSGIAIKLAQARNGKVFHCECGDRFGTIPPHAKSLRLGLVASVEEMSV